MKAVAIALLAIIIMWHAEKSANEGFKNLSGFLAVMSMVLTVTSLLLVFIE